MNIAQKSLVYSAAVVAAETGIVLLVDLDGEVPVIEFTIGAQKRHCLFSTGSDYKMTPERLKRLLLPLMSEA